MALGRQIDHSHNVDVQSIRACFSQCGRYRYLLTIPYVRVLQQPEIVSVILKNPSSADESRADPTIRNVEGYIYCNFPQCGELRILNLFAYRDTYGLQARIQEDFDGAVGLQNDSFLNSSFCSSTHIIVGWGQQSKIKKPYYDCRIDHVNQLLRPYETRLLKVGDLIENRYPRHGLMWYCDEELTSYSLPPTQC